MFVKSLYRKTAKMQNWFTDGTVPAFRLSRSLSFPSLLQMCIRDRAVSVKILLSTDSPSFHIPVPTQDILIVGAIFGK